MSTRKNNYISQRDILRNKLKTNVQKLLSREYQTDEIFFFVKQLNYVIFNEKSLIVAFFKDRLIFDDSSEFLRRFYGKIDQREKLRKILDFYEENSKIFPNYIILSEARYIYKNIQKKQKLIDQLQEIEDQEKEKKPIQNNSFSHVLKTEDYDTIMNQSQSKFSVTNDITNKDLSIENLIENIEKADFYKTNKNYQQISQKIQGIISENQKNIEKKKIEPKLNHNKTNSVPDKDLLGFKNKSTSKGKIVTKVRQNNSKQALIPNDKNPNKLKTVEKLKLPIKETLKENKLEELKKVISFHSRNISSNLIKKNETDKKDSFNNFSSEKFFSIAKDFKINRINSMKKSVESNDFTTILKKNSSVSTKKEAKDKPNTSRNVVSRNHVINLADINKSKYCLEKDKIQFRTIDKGNSILNNIYNTKKESIDIFSDKKTLTSTIYKPEVIKKPNFIFQNAKSSNFSKDKGNNTLDQNVQMKSYFISEIKKIGKENSKSPLLKTENKLNSEKKVNVNFNKNQLVFDTNNLSHVSIPNSARIMNNFGKK